MNNIVKGYYSSMFDNLNRQQNNKTNMLNIDFTEHQLISNGTYLTLAKAFYKKNPEQAQSDAKELISSDKAHLSISKDAESLVSDSEAMQKKGVHSLFKQTDITTDNEDGTTTTTKGYDMNAITEGANSFISSYNDLLKSGDGTTNTSIKSRIESLTNTTKNHQKALSKVGITFDKDGKLSIDEKVFKEADITDIKNLFHESGSYGAEISRKADYTKFTADNSMSNPFNSGYDKSGNVNKGQTTGDFMDEWR